MDDLIILEEEKTIYFDGPGGTKGVSIPQLSQLSGVVTPDATSMMRRRHPKFENDERYATIVRYAEQLKVYGVELVYFERFDYSKGLQLETDDRTRDAQCRKNALNDQMVQALTNTFNNGAPVHKPPVTVWHPNWATAYVGAGNHRVHGKVGSNDSFGPLLMLKPAKGSQITSRQMESILASVARKSNAETDDDVSTDTDEDICYQIAGFFKKLMEYTPEERCSSSMSST